MKKRAKILVFLRHNPMLTVYGVEPRRHGEPIYGKDTQMKQEIKKSFLKGAAFAGGAAVFIGLTFIVAQSINTFTSGEVVSASKINANFQMAAPEGAIMAFYLSACPDGWILADGTNSTPDLRGRFVRGRDPGNATSRDPDGARTEGAAQDDAFQGHWHDLYGHDGDVGPGPPYIPRNIAGTNATNNVFDAGVRAPRTDGTNGTPRTANETRPKNVALTFCMRKDT
ncbi:MAG: tail fiber protein [Spirochaetales bacterium]|nr:tail fiber protein [Spirochaetales bacterium]